ncbi:hypothetical protein ColTof4_14032 [Colletotrichum tofieldiae]|nr:hypothetical protein ColTof4_14032 [Colletotrichum tofieldiae]
MHRQQVLGVCDLPYELVPPVTVNLELARQNETLRKLKEHPLACFKVGTGAADTRDIDGDFLATHD